MSLKNWLRKAKWKSIGMKQGGANDARTIAFVHIDHFTVIGTRIIFEGWFAPYREAPYIVAATAVAPSGETIFRAEVPLRPDGRIEGYLGRKSAHGNGFSCHLEYESSEALEIWLELTGEGKTTKMLVGIADPNTAYPCKPQVKSGDTIEAHPLIDLGAMQFNPEFFLGLTQNAYDPVDIVIPIYNGYDYLEPLFASIPKTSSPFRVIAIDDASPDERILPFLHRMQDTADYEIVILENEQNIGFVGSVNRALAESDRNVVLLNTDTELPSCWLERLIYPLVEDPQIASVTPYTNCGTICSFPRFLEDNDLMKGFTLEEMDDQFKKMQPVYTEIPTGVGFCMAMSKSALQDIGFFNEEAFGKGYGEENDWCQRAIKAGYKNVMAENLFVYHKHGGSFSSDEKRELAEANGQKLLELHPDYMNDVNEFCAIDPLREYRNFVEALIEASRASAPTVVFNHGLGGGATAYLEHRIAKPQQPGKSVATIAYSKRDKVYSLALDFQDGRYQAFAENLSALLVLLGDVEEILLNELVTYPFASELLAMISELQARTGARMEVVLHDYFCICPSQNLIDYEDRLCGVPSDMMRCQRCYKALDFKEDGCGETIELYRKSWWPILSMSESITCFSESSRDYLMRAYPNLENINVVPHEVDSLRPVDKAKYDHDEIRIGFIGIMSKQKGSSVVDGLIAANGDGQASFKLIGLVADESLQSDLDSTGLYARDSLPDLLEENEIDVVFIASVVPETFSYTASEAMMMGMPLVVFDFGAPCERVKDYAKGLVLPFDTSYEDMLREVVSFAERFKSE